MNSQQSSQGGQTYQTPQINPYQMLQNQAATGFLTGSLLPGAGGAIGSATNVYNQALGGVNQAGTSLANYANTGSQLLGRQGAQNFQTGSQGLSSLFSPEYEQQQIAASQIPAQLQYQQNLAGQQAGFGGAGQLGSARQAIAGTALAQQNQLQQQQAAAQMQNQIAQNRMQAGQALMQGGQGAITQGGALNQLGLTAAQAPMDLATKYASIYPAMASLGQGQFAGTSGMITTSGENTSKGQFGI